jgi:hypothetical protein
MSIYIKFGITERQGDTECEHNMVAEVPDGTTLDQLNDAMKRLLLDFYADCEWDESDPEPFRVWTPHDSLCWITGDVQIREHEFQVLRDHMSNMTYNMKQYLTNPEFRL